MGTPARGRPGRTTLLLSSVVSVGLWYVPGAFLVVYPVRLFVTLVHEAAHAGVAVLTGGVVGSISVDPGGSGLTQTQGGLPLLIYPAGYVGAASLGALLLMLVAPRKGRATLGALAVLLIGVTLLWARDPFTVTVGVVLSCVLLLLRRFLPSPAADFAVGFLAVQLCLNAILDVRTLLWLTTSTGAPNDAVFMARNFGLVPWVWALLWAAFSVALLVTALRVSWSSTRA